MNSLHVIERLKKEIREILESELTLDERIFYLDIYKFLTDKRIYCSYELGIEIIQFLMKNNIKILTDFRNTGFMIITLK